jgi:uncharacterized membrane protein YtjA (UPF0391 family)
VAREVLYLLTRRRKFLQEEVMLRAAIAFFVLAIIAAFLGFGGLAASAAGISKILFLVFLVLALVSFLMGRRVAA